MCHTGQTHHVSSLKIYRWEDGNNLTSNLFTLITPLAMSHKTTSDICSYKPYTEKKEQKKIKKLRKINTKTVRYVH